jgi:cation-transporting ATPase 13A1
MSLEVRYLQKRSITMRLDVCPFIVLHLILLSTHWRQDFASRYILLSFPLLIIQVLFHLSSHWSRYMRALICYSSSQASDSTHVLVKSLKPKHSHRVFDIVPLRSQNPVSFDYLHQHYIYDSDKRQYQKVTYPTSCNFSYYTSSRGYSEESLKEVQERWGSNNMKFPIPTYWELLGEHVVAPFFVFQLFCVGLWMLDEYWHLSLYTLVMLFMFESTVVMQRLSNWRRLQATRKPPIEIS